MRVRSVQYLDPAIANVSSELHGRCRLRRVRTVLSLDPVMTNVSDLHGRESVHVDLLSPSISVLSLGPAVANSLAGGRRRRMRVPSVQFLDPGVANVSWELHGMVSTQADSLSRQYQYYL